MHVFTVVMVSDSMSLLTIFFAQILLANDETNNYTRITANLQAHEQGRQEVRVKTKTWDVPTHHVLRVCRDEYYVLEDVEHNMTARVVPSMHCVSAGRGRSERKGR